MQYLNYGMIEPSPRSDNGLMTQAILFRYALISQTGVEIANGKIDFLWLCLARVSLSRSSVLLSPVRTSFHAHRLDASTGQEGLLGQM